MELRDKDLLRYDGYIDGTWSTSADGGVFGVHNPADGTEIGHVARMTAADARRAVEAADEALSGWSGRTAAERYLILRRWADLLREHVDDLALILTTEQGKPLAESRGEVLYSAAFLDWFGEEGKRVYGETIPSPQRDRRLFALKEPVGVGAGITPWNFPLSMPARKAAAALAAGCTIVVKPAEQTPLIALALAELAHRAGVPQGVFNVVPTDEAGANEVGGELTGNPMVRMLSFTGSTAVGKQLMGQCASGVKKVSLELGGSAPFIVFDDADLDEAVLGLLATKYRNSGQMCVSANRVLVQAGVYDDFLDRLVKATREKVVVGPGTDDRVTAGPLIDEQGLAKVERHVEDAVSKGARVALGGARSKLGGTFYEATVIDGIDSSMVMMHEETFGPVAGLTKFESEDEAIEIANDTPYGLAGYFYSLDVRRVWRVTEALEFGIVGVNTGVISAEAAPFGGMKESGLGREGSHLGIEEWLETKYMCLAGL